MKQCPINGNSCDRPECQGGTEFDCGAQAFAKSKVQVILVEQPPPGREEHIGDGCYASFDGWQIRLRAPREEGDHMVYLEPGVFAELMAFAKRVGLLR